MLTTTDVVIVGGGPAGAAIALALARRGLSPIVIEAQSTPKMKVGECLPPDINPLLNDFGLTERLLRRGNLPSHGNRFVWGSDSIQERDFIFGSAGTGWRLDRRSFEEELMSAAVEAGGRWQCGRRLTSISREKNHRYMLTVTGPQGVDSYQADFVVDATGRSAKLARSLNAHRVVYDRLIGIATYFAAPAPSSSEDDSFTLVEAVPSGWWYSSRLPGGKLIAVYMTDSDLLDPDDRRSDGWFTLLKQAKFTAERVFEYAEASTTPRILPAHTVRLSTIAGEGWLAVGDSAVSFDPLASHGILMAVESGLRAASTIADYLSGGADNLRSYERIIDQAFAQYLLMRRDAYLGEQRWPSEPFWRRRHAPSFKTDTAKTEFTLSFKSGVQELALES
jgi:flavin-dependent dehydrogenase